MTRKNTNDCITETKLIAKYQQNFNNTITTKIYMQQANNFYEIRSQTTMPYAFEKP